MSFKTQDDFVDEMCQVYDIYQKHNEDDEINNILDLEGSLNNSLRKILIALELNHIQERIDIDKYMFNPE